MPVERLADRPDLAAFLEHQMAAVIAVPVDANGTLHAATVSYWNAISPLAVYFVTNRESEKCQLLKSQASIPCACVIGTEKGTEFTLQMRGTLSEAANLDLAGYFQKQSNRPDARVDAKDMVLVFTPTWARFTDYKVGYQRHTLELSGENNSH